MISRNDLDAAIAWQLQGVPTATVEKAAQAVFNLVHMGQGIELTENSMAAILASFGMVPGGKVVSVFRALVAKGALAVENWHLFYPSAYSSLESHRQAQRAAGRSRGDALDDLLRGALDELPDLTPALLWAEVSRRAGDGAHPAIADYDPRSGVVTYEPRPGAELEDINYQAFRRRVQRLKSRMPATAPLPRSSGESGQGLLPSPRGPSRYRSGFAG